MIGFKVKPNYFISITDPLIEECLCLRIQTKNSEISDLAEDLAISWTSINEYTNTAEVEIKEINNKIIELFEPNKFTTEIQLKLLHLKDLSIPKDWMIDRISGTSTSKPVSTIEYMSSGDRLYFKNNAITNTKDNLVLPSNSQIEEEEDNVSTNSITPIGMKTVQIPIFPTEPSRNFRNTRMEEIQSTTIIQQMKIGKNDIIIFSNFQPRKYNTYIEITLQFRDYKTYSLHALLDTGATTSSCRENAIPVEK